MSDFLQSVLNDTFQLLKYHFEKSFLFINDLNWSEFFFERCLNWKYYFPSEFYVQLLKLNLQTKIRPMV